MNKVIVIGLDGLEPQITEAMLAQGRLPHLARLRQQGGYARLQTTYPAQTPVAWATFATGVNPGGHGIFDFLRRDPNTYLPALATNTYQQKNPFVPPQAVNLRKGLPLWSLLSQARLPSTVIRCPVTFPPDRIQGRMLSGVGVPDLRGGLGTSTFYCSTEHLTPQQETEKIVPVQPGPDGVIATHLLGPQHPKTRADLKLDITLHPEHQKKRVILRSPGQPHLLELQEGEWSGWLRVKFKVGLLQSVSGMVRFYLARMAPVFELYASPINFDPQAPQFPISFPQEYAGELARQIGAFYTTGMAEDHDGLNHERFDEGAYLKQCQGVLAERAQMMRYELDRFDEGFFFCLFDTPDRIQHMFWRFREKEHPANRHHQDYRPELARVIEENYQACDALVGEAMASADDQTLFMVLSDHGNNSFQRGLHLNTWLYEQGLLALKKGAQPGEEAGEFFRQVDWAKTKAYALGLGGIYLNLQGREAQGIVDPAEAEALKAALAQGLSGLGDPERGRRAVRSVLPRERVYAGPYVAEAPDLLVNFEAGYRVSWATPLGGVPQGLFEDNIKKWAGDHMIDPGLAPGVLLVNQPFSGGQPSLLDLAPTILAALGAPLGPAMEGRSLVT
jgi:predicted AlkP superfamily phosphohydrolase/phosphomutase